MIYCIKNLINFNGLESAFIYDTCTVSNGLLDLTAGQEFCQLCSIVSFIALALFIDDIIARSD